MIKFNCQNCGQRIKVSDQVSGKKGKCPKCKHIVVVPKAESIDSVPNQKTSSNESPPSNKPVLKFNCQKCSGDMEAPQALRGKLLLCPNCGSNAEVPQKEISEEKKRTVDELFLAKLKKSCPYCGAPILEVVPRCKHCGGFLNLSYLLPANGGYSYLSGDNLTVQPAAGTSSPPYGSYKFVGWFCGIMLVVVVIFCFYLYIVKDSFSICPDGPTARREVAEYVMESFRKDKIGRIDSIWLKCVKRLEDNRFKATGYLIIFDEKVIDTVPDAWMMVMMGKFDETRRSWEIEKRWGVGLREQGYRHDEVNHVYKKYDSKKLKCQFTCEFIADPYLGHIKVESLSKTRGILLE